jgi:hypothetical protein
MESVYRILLDYNSPDFVFWKTEYNTCHGHFSFVSFPGPGIFLQNNSKRKENNSAMVIFYFTQFLQSSDKKVVCQWGTEGVT